MNAIRSDRDWRFNVTRSSEYWGDRDCTVTAPHGDTVRVDAYDHDSHLDLTPVEARSLAAALIACAAQIEGDAPDPEDECEGHESLDGAHMGVTVYCDGTCISGSRAA